ncbi:hypothetical protein NL676_025719 [Syzygium grande]|nr:hypothetical protein NL676_025719 [Syzygium grande]
MSADTSQESNDNRGNSWRPTLETDGSQDAFDVVMTKEGDRGATGENDSTSSDPRPSCCRRDRDEEREGGRGRSIAADDDNSSGDMAKKCPEVT